MAWVVVMLTVQPPVCGPKQDLLGYLFQVSGERIISMDIIENDTDKAIVLTGNRMTGSWSMVQVWTHGAACLVRSGIGVKIPEWT